MLERYLIHYFLAVVDQGNFSRAAQQCGVSQPTLSVGIAKLETAIGHVLFHRTSRRIEMTAAGARFAEHARRIEAEFAKTLHAMTDNSSVKLIRMGVVSTLPSIWIELALREAGEVEEEQLEIMEGRMRDLLPRLERGRIDVVVGILGNDARERETLFEEGYSLALPTNHPFAHQKNLKAEEVANAQMIVRRHCEALPATSRFFTLRGVRPFFSARTTSDDRALAFVRAGLGITVMPNCFAQPGIAMPSLSGFDERRRIGILADPSSAARIEGSECLKRFSATLRALARMNAAK